MVSKLVFVAAFMVLVSLAAAAPSLPDSELDNKVEIAPFVRDMLKGKQMAVGSLK